VAPLEENLSTRVGCNLGPWGDYLIAVCAELIEDYHLDGYSFDGNYHPPICFCPACQQAYRQDRGRDLPSRVDLDSVPYREYLVWRGERLEDHYRRLQAAIKRADPQAALMSWTVNAGRYGHLLHSPRAMPTRLNLLFDLPMQEWWLDETNLGASVAPAFGAAYLRAVAGERPAASEPYLMSRGNPYGTHSFPSHERLTRVLLAITNGCLAPEAFGWPGHRESTATVFAEVARRERWTIGARPVPWAAMLVSEQTRQFYAYQDIADRSLPHLFGAFRAGMEEHLPLTLVNDWDLTPSALAPYAVLLLPNAAALSDRQLAAVREYVRGGGGVVASADTSVMDELGRPRPDFGLADLFGVSYGGRPRAAAVRPLLDANFAVTVNESYWKERVGVGTLTWQPNPLVDDPRLAALVPGRSVLFRGPQVKVSEPSDAGDVAVRLQPEGASGPPLPGIIARSFGKGKVVYLAAEVDAGLWSYAFPYQRRLLARAVGWAAAGPPPFTVEAPMCVQTTLFEQPEAKRTVIHLFNGVNTTANHGLPAQDVPLREEVVPVHGIQIHLAAERRERFHVEPEGIEPAVRREGAGVVVEMPPLEVHSMLVVE
jgi:hypothetical protein